jgi:hypothetical protein
MPETPNPPNTLEGYAEDRAALNQVKAPAKFASTSNGMVGHLLKRVGALETAAEAAAPKG